MIDIENGRYWDEGITLIESCTRISPGCKNCWSLAREKRFHQGIEGEIVTHPERLKRFNTRKPKVFSLWNDLLHEGVKTRFIAETIEAMQINKSNIFLVLTKRPERLAKFAYNWGLLPLHNVYWGLTVCNQQEADEKIPIFLTVPGKKFLSIEPCLGPVDLLGLGIVCQKSNSDLICTDTNRVGCITGNCKGNISFDAVILGGETGPGARPLNPEWVRSVRDQCAASNMPFFFKGWGEWAPSLAGFCYHEPIHGGPVFPTQAESKRTYQWDTGYGAVRIGRKKAGRLLDGYTHDDLPWRKP